MGRFVSAVLTTAAAIGLVVTGPVQAGGSATTLYTPAQLAKVIDPKPKVPRWSFKRGDSYIFPVPAHYPAFTLDEWLGEQPTEQQKAVADKLKQAGFEIGRHLVWNGTHADAIVYAYLFSTAAGSAAGFRALEGPTRNLPLAGLQKGSLLANGSYGALYIWRRGNLVVVAGMNCDDGCRTAMVQPTRDYAREIDRRMQRRSA